jgi:hypothetical protein
MRTVELCRQINVYSQNVNVVRIPLKLIFESFTYDVAMTDIEEFLMIKRTGHNAFLYLDSDWSGTYKDSKVMEKQDTAGASVEDMMSLFAYDTIRPDKKIDNYFKRLTEWYGTREAKGYNYTKVMALVVGECPALIRRVKPYDIKAVIAKESSGVVTLLLTDWIECADKVDFALSDLPIIDTYTF